MFLPLVGFIVSLLLFTIIGIIVISVIPNFKLNIPNILAFDFGAYIFVIISSILYNFLFSNNGQLESTFAVIFYFVVLFLSLIMGGILSLQTLHKFQKPKTN